MLKSAPKNSRSRGWVVKFQTPQKKLGMSFLGKGKINFIWVIADGSDRDGSNFNSGVHS